MDQLADLFRRQCRHGIVMGAVLISLSFGGCTSGGGDSSPTAGAPASPSTTLTGAAVANAIDGTVCAYKVTSAGAEGDKLGCALTDPKTGGYTITFSGYTGDVLVKAFGRYTDEATGKTVTILEGSALRALVACATGGTSCQAAVTPLTEAALRTAGTLTRVSVEEAYRKIAEAYGLNPSSISDAVNKLVTTIPTTTSRNDANATKYADILALASQAQKRYCGDSTTCTLNDYLDGVRDLIGKSAGTASLQSEINAALQEWNSNPLNKTGVTCSYGNGTVTCNVSTAPVITPPPAVPSLPSNHAPTATAA